MAVFVKYDRDNDSFISPEEILTFMLEVLGENKKEEAASQVEVSTTMTSHLPTPLCLFLVSACHMLCQGPLS